MQVHKLAWVGTRTEAASQTVAFFRDVLGLREDHAEEDFWVLKLPDGAKVEVFGPRHEHNRHFVTGPVAGFLVDDVRAAAEELRAAGVEIVHGPITWGEEGTDTFNAWVHFRAPDGNLYEFTQDPGVSRPG
jgi:catechol 2,3-dioxygenase-like lactoylglutathione lyase family enzyme